MKQLTLPVFNSIKNPFWLRLFVALLFSVLILFFISIGWLDAADQFVSDRFYQKSGAGSHDIIVIGIDQASLDVLGPMPWPRYYMADAITYLNNADPEARPAVIGVDVLYSGEGWDPVADQQLSDAAAQYGNVVVASAAVFGSQVVDSANQVYSLEQRSVIGWDVPYDALLQAADTGHVNAMADTDGIFRHALLYVDNPDGSRMASFARVIYEKWCDAAGELPSPLPQTTSNGFYYLPFSTAGGGYCDGINFLDLLDGDVDPIFFKDKIVLIGPYASGMQDACPTSLDHASQMYGIDIQANTIEAFQKGFYPREANRNMQALLLFLISVFIAFFFWKRDLRTIIITWLVVCLVWIGSCAIFYHMGIILHLLWIPVSVSILFLASVLLNYIRIRKEKLRISAELDIARRIQVNMLPSQFPPFPDRKEFSLFASMTPAKEVGGDFFDFFRMDESHLGLVIGDVSGKGVPASLLMTVSMFLIRDHTMQTSSPAEVLRAVNEMLCSRNEENMFVTVWLGILDLRTGELIAASAGHEYPILKDPDNGFQVFKDRHGLPVGACEGVSYREYSLHLSPGSVLFVYTDGLPEATDQHNVQFGLERAISVLNAAPDLDPEVLIHTIHDAVDSFVGSASQFDDLTMLSLIWLGPANLL